MFRHYLTVLLRYFYRHTFYAPERTLQSMLSIFALLAMFITCLGVLGLTTCTLDIRKKEIAIRKILGASTSRILAFSTRDTLLVFLCPHLLAWPLAYLQMDSWLSNFAGYPILYTGRK